MDMDLGFTPLIVDECRHQGALRNQAAYILATAYWETGRTMKPVEEAFFLGDKADAHRKALRYYPWHGRGFVQLTWKENYERAGLKLGQDFTTDPARVMEPEFAVQILVAGCLEGWFTGKKLGDYITLERSDFRNARRVVNGTDKAEEIAKIARKYDAELRAMGYGVETPDQPQEAPMKTGVMQFIARMGIFSIAPASIGAMVAGAVPGVEWVTFNGAEGWFINGESVFDLAMNALILVGGPIGAWAALWNDARKKGKLR